MPGKKLLLIAFHFPPVQGSTGVHRCVALAKYLQECGWDVTVLTAAERAYPSVRAENLRQIPPGVRVVRAFALDTKRHLSLFGRYPQSLSVPDRWRSWIPGALFAARRLMRHWQPDLIMSTFPIASAHAIALELHRRHAVPWIADFRDPMVQDTYPKEANIYAAYQKIETAVFEHAARVTVTTPGAAEMYAARYPRYPQHCLRVLSNGFDEEAFAAIGAMGGSSATMAKPRRALTLLHSGLLYPNERNPEVFFRAVAELSSEGVLSPAEVQFCFRGSGHVERYEPMIAAHGIGELVRLLPPVPYSDALRELIECDACMLFQASNCNQQIPAKLYEYLYAGKPILGLTDPAGDTGRLMRDFGISSVTPLDDLAAMKVAIPRFLEDVRRGSTSLPTREQVMRYSRRSLIQDFAGQLEGLRTSA